MSYRLGNLDPDWAICLKMDKTFLEVGKKNYSWVVADIVQRTNDADRTPDWRLCFSTHARAYSNVLDDNGHLRLGRSLHSKGIRNLGRRSVCTSTVACTNATPRVRGALLC